MMTIIYILGVVFWIGIAVLVCAILCLCFEWVNHIWINELEKRKEDDA